MTRTQELRALVKDARDDWNHNRNDETIDKILTALDILVSDRERAEKAAAREQQIFEARHSL